MGGWNRPEFPLMRIKLTAMPLALAAWLWLAAWGPATSTVFFGANQFELVPDIIRNYSGIVPVSGRLAFIRAPYIRSAHLFTNGILNRELDEFSGALSYEFHRKNFYMGNSGGVLFTAGIPPLYPGFLFGPIDAAVVIRSPGRVGWGTFVLQELRYDRSEQHFVFKANSKDSVGFAYF